MSTPKEIIEEFDKKFWYLQSELDVVTDDVNSPIPKEIKSFLISKMISEYEEMLGEVEGMKHKCGEKNVYCLYSVKNDSECPLYTGYSESRDNLLLFLQSKLKAWRELLDNK